MLLGGKLCASWGSSTRVEAWLAAWDVEAAWGAPVSSPSDSADLVHERVRGRLAQEEVALLRGAARAPCGVAGYLAASTVG